MMRKSIIIWVMFSALAYCHSGLVAAADSSAGQRIFERNCASCHGVDGKGAGWLSEYLKSPAPALVQLKKKNRGEFPKQRVYQIIEGRAEVKAHGPRAMPIWGAEFDTQSTSNEPCYSKDYTEEMIRKRILAVIDYLVQIQE